MNKALITLSILATLLHPVSILAATPTPKSITPSTPTQTPSVSPSPTATPSATLTPTPSLDSPTPKPTTTQIETGDAEAKIEVTNIANLNETGLDTCIFVRNVQEERKTNLDLTESCTDVAVVLPEDEINELTQNDNNSDLQIELEAIAKTGANVSVVPDTVLQTGDAHAQVDLFNLINTNLTGDNTLFGVINLFEQTEGNILLPYEVDYLLSDGSLESSSSAILQQNDNQTKVTTSIDATANTGDNTVEDGESASISTGDAQITLNLYDKINTNISGSHFLLLEVNTFGDWHGTVHGLSSETYQHDDKLFMINMSPSQPTATEVTNSSTAAISNILTLKSSTGDNKLQNRGVIRTGDATAKANVFNYINTNITGSNWYHLVINLFDDFSGDIVFPRPDLQIDTKSDKEEYTAADELRLDIDVQNTGVLWAKDTKLTTKLPDGFVFESATGGGKHEDGRVEWYLDQIGKTYRDTFQITGRISNEAKALRFSSQISTQTFDPHQENNTSIIDVLLKLVSLPVEKTKPDDKQNSTDTNQNNTKVQEYIEEMKELQTSEVRKISRESQSSDYAGYVVTRETNQEEDVLGNMVRQDNQENSSASVSGSFIIAYIVGVAVLFLKEIFDW